MKKNLLIVALLIISLITGCSSVQNAQDTSVGDNGSIILATTTSTRDSGLLDYILPDFEEKTGIEVKVVAVGTGAALQKGRDGDADVLLVHAKPSEEQFVEEGHGLKRYDVMYNDFVIVGPKEDSANIHAEAANDVVKGFQTIAESESTFVSRGDDSGTHKKEKSIWENAGIQPEGSWYLSSGSGMGDTLKIADEKQAYTMTDRATYLNLKDKLNLDILVEKDEMLFNQYGVIPVNPDKNENINNGGAQEFIDWLLSEDIQKMIGEYGKDKFGMPLFTPNYNK
ncbi:substrate-binding domain-containing protein [Sporosalibacterium faouarense]|uniref:substrate-binding domain-containing protein n=1 Tax=Sporosalibacterium faouarense TaxID=516123 RepID=UPI00192AB56B|nr:substrate-binding domain-containing protein [Sporosalibacterium faouarense]